MESVFKSNARAAGSWTNSSLRPFTTAEMRSILLRLGEHPESVEEVYRRRNRIVLRWSANDRGSIIIKMWSRPGVRGSIRRRTRTGSCDFEYANLARLHRAGVPVPKPLGMCQVPPNTCPYSDAVFMEDLGDCRPATDHLKRLIRENDEQAVARFEDEVIEITRRIINAGMVDTDHGMVNTVVTEFGHPIRLDTEMARRVLWPAFSSGRYGRMVGWLLGTYAFAVQPDSERVIRFANRLTNRLRLSPRVVRRASRQLQQMLANQRCKRGIDTHVDWPQS